MSISAVLTSSWRQLRGPRASLGRVVVGFLLGGAVVRGLVVDVDLGRLNLVGEGLEARIHHFAGYQSLRDELVKLVEHLLTIDPSGYLQRDDGNPPADFAGGLCHFQPVCQSLPDVRLRILHRPGDSCPTRDVVRQHIGF